MSVCTFTVAVNNKYKPDDPAQFFRVTTWRKLADNCGKYLTKGSKVAVNGAVKLNTYTGQDGATRANLEVDATDVEFLTANGDGSSSAPSAPSESGYTNVTEAVEDDLPF